MRPHLPEEELHAWLDGQLSQSQRAEIAEHLLGCLICRALEAEAKELRDRTSALLELAVPDQIRGMPLPRPSHRLRWGRVSGLAAAAVAVVGTSWMMTDKEASTGLGSSSVVAIATTAEPLLADYPAPIRVEEPAPAALAPTNQSRATVLASRASLTPHIVRPTGYQETAQRRLRVVDPMSGATQLGVGGGWQTSSFEEARAATTGSLPYLDGIEISAVRLQPSSVGGRPTAMVRQLLPDGRVLWVVEGALEELEQVYPLLQASGLTIGTPRRGRPDYIGPDDAPVRTTRMVAVAAYLPVDSLDRLTANRLRSD